MVSKVSIHLGREARVEQRGSQYGVQEAEKGAVRCLEGPTPTGLLPPSRSRLLKFPDPSNTVLPGGRPSPQHMRLSGEQFIFKSK
jgi:hypothetical protein